MHQKRLPYSPYQNGKQASSWATLERRLIPVLDGYPERTRGFRNEASQGWVEVEDNRRVHRELGTSPMERLDRARDVLRERPSREPLRGPFAWT